MDLFFIIIYVVLVMFVLVFVEYFIWIWKLCCNYDIKDVFVVIVVGIGNIIFFVLIKVFIFGLVLVCYNLVLWSIFIIWWFFVFCFVVLDFCWYWVYWVVYE